MISWILGEFTKHAMVEPWVSPSCEGLKKTWTLHVEWFLVLVIQQKLAGNHSCQFFPVQTTDILMLDSSTIVVNFQPFCSLSGKCLNWSCFLRWNAHPTIMGEFNSLTRRFQRVSFFRSPNPENQQAPNSWICGCLQSMCGCLFL